MSGTKRVSPAEARELIGQGYTYVDVRSVEEFHVSHPTGSVNVPLTAMGSSGAPPPAEFLAAIERLFARDAKIIVGCAVGGRSMRASHVLAAAGFTDVVDQRAGMDGARSAFGGMAEAGWAGAGLPVSSGPDEGSFDAVMKRGSR